MYDQWSNEIGGFGGDKAVECHELHMIGGSVVGPRRVVEVVNGAALTGLLHRGDVKKETTCIENIQRHKIKQKVANFFSHLTGIDSENILLFCNS